MARPHSIAALVVALAASCPLAAEPATVARPAVDRIFDAVQRARADAGVGVQDRRAALDAVALRRARRVAALPDARRLSDDVPLRDDLEAEGIKRFQRAVDRLIVMSGQDPVDGVLDHWRRYRAAWETAMDPELNAAGVAGVTTEDGWFVFVAVLVQDQNVPADLAPLEQAVVDAINAVRKRNDLEPLTVRWDLAAVARAHSRDMAARGYFAHAGPGGEGPAERVRRAGIAYRATAENLQLNHAADDPVASAVQGWLHSPGHLANILTPEFSETGVGIAVAEDGTYYFTQLFLQPPQPEGRSE